MLRLIDNWIDSGRNADGSESPTRRNHGRAQEAWSDACWYFKEHAQLQLIPGEPPQLRLSAKWNKVWGTLEARARNGLIMATVLLSDLRFRLAKCRYQKCGRYFLLSHPREKPHANGLFCCTAHNRAEAAMKGMKLRRAEATASLIESAAREVWRQKKQGRAFRVKERLVATLNQQIARDRRQTREQLHVNWVTRHWKEIQKKAEELSHVKTQSAR